MALKYTGGQIQRVYSAELNNIAYANQNGVLTGCEVTASSPEAMTVEIASGEIFFGNDEINVSATTSSTFDNNATAYTRLDLVVVNGSGTVSIVKGTASSLPSAPDYDPESYVVLAIVTLTSGISSIGSSNISDIRVLNQGGAGGEAGAFGRHLEEFTSQTSVTVTHNLGDDEPIVAVYNDSDVLITPDTVTIVDKNSLTVTFSTPTSGKIVVYGGAGVNNAYYQEEFSSATTWNVNHKLDQQYVNVTCYDSSDNIIEPSTVTMDDANNCTVTFGVATSGKVVVTGGSTSLELVKDETPQLGGNLDLNNYGFTEQLTAGESLVSGDLVYLKDDGKMWKADASAESTSDTLLALAIESISADASGTFLLYGRYTTSGLTSGAIYYVSETAGGITTTAPTTSTSIVRVIGYALSSTELMVDPDKTYIEVA